MSDSYPARACERYAMRVPSGEYAGAPSNPGLVVSRFGWPPLASISNRSAFVLVASTASVIAM
ncbi:MAG: hypothetical protein DMG03_14465 [Acidobacteria bacterium]|nr:MAG: hypothetical protein DMG03_14465 [Acidobacteriota bacterium]